MEIIHATEKDYNNIIKNKFVLVDFYADWCGPCKMLGTVLEDLKDEIQIVKVNVDECENLARDYGVMSIPNMFLMKDGDIIASRLGYATKEDLQKWIKDNN